MALMRGNSFPAPMGNEPPANEPLIQSFAYAFGSYLLGQRECFRPPKPDIAVVKPDLLCQCYPFLSHLSGAFFRQGNSPSLYLRLTRVIAMRSLLSRIVFYKKAVRPCPWTAVRYFRNLLGIRNDALGILPVISDQLIKRFTLENGICEIPIGAELTDGTYLHLRPLDIETLAERYPDCKMGY